MKRMIALTFAVATAASLAVVAQAPPAAGGSPDDGRHRSANVTFTKWVTSLPTDPSTVAGVSVARRSNDIGVVQVW